MKTFNSLIILFLFFFSACQNKKQVSQASIKHETIKAEKPNVLFIIVDDLNDWVGYLKGHPQSYTPNINRLAARGIAFNNAHCNSPLCGPSRSSLLTGKFPSSTGIYFHIADTALAIYQENQMPEVAFLPDYFEQAGYKTFGVGKIFHNGDAANIFDEYGGLANFGPRPEKRFKYDPTWFDKPQGTSTDWGAFPQHDSLTFDQRIANWAIDKLAENHEEPFLLMAGFMRPHVPWYVPQKWFDHLENEEIILPKYLPEDWDDIPELASKITDLAMMPEMEWMEQEHRWEEAVKAYLASVTFVDYQIGRLLDALESSPYADNTLIVFTSDHGYHLGEKGLFQKSTLWQRSTHVPLIIAGKGMLSKVDERPSSLIDIYPTLIYLCGLAPNTSLEGNNLLGDTTAQTMPTAITTYGYKNHSIYRGNWHYIQYEDGDEELYHIKNDPQEWNNLAKDETSICEELAQYLPKNNRANIPASRLHNTPYFLRSRENHQP